MTPDVVTLSALSGDAATACVHRYGARLVMLPVDAAIPHSFWGAPEAGLARGAVYVRPDTPVHSLLHELGHYVCMTPARRDALDTHAGGDVDEECAVCALQLLLANEIPGFGFERALRDMDAWGYSFREGSARAWWHGDAEDARTWLRTRHLIDTAGHITWRLRA